MRKDKLLSIEPLELKFLFELRKQISCTVQLANKTDNYVAFKVLTTNTKNYIVHPKIGVVLPQSTCDIIVTMQAQKEAPPNLQCKDKFLIQSFIAPEGTMSKNITSKMFSKEGGNEIKECKLQVIYVCPPQPPIRVFLGIDHHFQTSTGELLNNEHLELKFPFELGKRISCKLQLVNEFDNYVAFKVKTTDPKKYCSRPNAGVVLPGSTCDVIVTMQAQKKVPRALQCNDKFLIQSFIALEGTVAKDITPEMFNKEGGHEVKECKLRVIHVRPPKPPPRVKEKNHWFRSFLHACGM